MEGQLAELDLVLASRLADGTIEWNPIQTPHRINATPDEGYALIDRTTYEAPESLVAQREKDDLVIDLDGGNVLVVQGFFATDGVAFYPTPEIAGGAGPFSGASLLPSAPVLAGSPEGAQVLWGEVPSGPDGIRQTAEVEDEDAARAADSASGSSSASPLLWGGLALGGLGLAAAGGGGGGGGSSAGDTGGSGDDSPPPEPVRKTVDGSVTAGPVVEGNGLTVELFEADGTTQLGTGQVASDGSFSIEIGDYTGVIIARIVDADSGADYLDEATGEDKDLSADLSAVIAVEARVSSLFVNVNPLTTLASRLAEREAGSALPSAEEIATSNAAIARLFGVDDLHGDPVVPVNGGTFDASDGLSDAETYGAILAAFSGATANNGGDSQATIDAVLDALSIANDGEAVLEESAQTLLIDGAKTTDAQSRQDLSSVVSAAVDTVAPAITSAATSPAIDENSGADQVVYTAAATDTAAITFSLAQEDDASAFDIDPVTGDVTLLASPDFETQASYTFTVIATDPAGNSTAQSVTLNINNLDDTAPTITSSDQAAPIDENSGAGQVVYTAVADDTGDLGGGNVTFALGSGGDEPAFEIDSDTGEVILTEDPDFETQSSYTFTVIVTDDAGNSDQQAISLNVNDLPETTTDTSVVVFDLLEGVSSDHSGRTFRSDVSYEIYIRVDSEEEELSTDGDGPGTWGVWRGAENLGSDDRVILVGSGTDIEGPQEGEVDQVTVRPNGIEWSSNLELAAALLRDGSFSRIADDDDPLSARLFETDLPVQFLVKQAGSLSTMYLTDMPVGILTSQGLV